MQMGARGLALVADPGDMLAGLDCVAGLDPEVVRWHVPVDGGEHAVPTVSLVVNDDPVAESRSGARFGDHAVGEGVDGSVHGCCVIDAPVVGAIG